jgi:transposase
MLNSPLEGRRHVRVRQRRTRQDFAEVIRELSDELYPEAEKIVLVMDNLNTHNTASLYEAFEPAQARRLAQKLEIHYTPKHGSWLNMAEIELSILSRQCMKDYFESIDELATTISAWERCKGRSKIAAGGGLKSRHPRHTYTTTPTVSITFYSLFQYTNKLLFIHCQQLYHLAADPAA